ncbi:polysaccharide lyase 6 family protein [Flexithrix dorotheae]|uniref:polysaccharide lyase 6 family protein n=1 Tax=Flexithrix dorotheae TaxID=70993 RepID=UPI00037A34AD|nr:polysaccharide lyase 6 family protein [Flexithrix dorotheae]
MKKLFTLIITTILIVFQACQPPVEKGVVENEEQLRKAIEIATPGDEIVMKNGIWKDIEILFQAKGEKENPIKLKAEEAGKVFIEGSSNLRIAGEFLEVSGLVFRNGFTPTSEVISFKKDKNNLANHCRVTNCAIQYFTNPERFESDYWVGMYGKNNRFDHNALIGKGNQGVTMAVRLNTEESRENNHRIDHNYFGPRASLGSNGGETLRIGTSHYSLTFSNTVVENNYFDRCSGELEIISNKSCGNTFKGNVFYECKGTLTMRHGNETLVENNYFLGNNIANTGGIRVINESQTVINNYGYGLKGYRFRGALVVMNGVPNSPINRYNQVIDSKIEGNILIDCDHIQLCAGSDEERSAIPQNTTFNKNIFLTTTNPKPFTVYDDISGISFNNNLINAEAEAPIKIGFSSVPYEVAETSNGLKIPGQSLLEKIAIKEPQLPVSKDEVGPDYLNKDIDVKRLSSGKEVKVLPGENTLIDAYLKSSPGDVLVLSDGEEYLLTKDLKISQPVTLRGTGAGKPVVKSQKSAFFKIENGGSLALENLIIDGAESPDQPGNSVVSTSKYSMNKNYNLFVKNCVVKDLDVNHTFDFLKIAKHTFADTILIENTQMTNVTGSVISLDKEVEDLGIYNGEYILIHQSTFRDVQGAVANIYRGGTDESTFGPIVRFLENEFSNVGKGKRNKIQASVSFHGVQNALVENCKWTNSAPINLHLTNGEPITIIKDCEMDNSGGIVANRNEFKTENIKISQ